MSSCSALSQYSYCVIEINMQSSEGRYYAKHFEIQEQRCQWSFCCSVRSSPDVWGRRNGRPSKRRTVSALKNDNNVILRCWSMTYPGRYCNSDYALASVLEQQQDQRFVSFSYDIECQHSINRTARFSKWFPHLVPIVKGIIGCIPKMHIHNHKDDCIYRYSFNYTPCVGCTCGEGIETTWAEANQTAGSTKENRGHHHDTLDDFHSYWNWEKIVKMGERQ